jgi:OmpA-OmpF porin, OOP family
MSKILLMFVLVLAVGITPADAQILKKARDAAKRGAERAIDREADRRSDEAVTRAVECVMGDVACAEEAKAKNQTVTYVEPELPASTPGASSSDAVAPSAAAPGKEAARPGEGAWSNYDFVPGERPLFVDDFTSDRVGDFPRRLEFIGGSMQIVEWNGQRWVSDGKDGEFYIQLPEVLPDRFTMEFDLAGSGNAMTIDFAGAENKWKTTSHVYFGTWFGGVRFGGDKRAQGELGVKTDAQAGTVRIHADGPYVKVYFNEARIAQVPNARDLGRSDRIHIFMNGWSADAPRMIANIRVMAGGTELYEALAAEGRVATQGILFDTGSDVIRPESTPTLKEIGAMLRAHPDLKLTIEGHTDNVGNEASNKLLSERRAESVRHFIIETYGVEAGRLTAVGHGQSQPMASNDTAEGRQQNRRVELVRM